MLSAQNTCNNSIILTDSLIHVSDSSGIKWFYFTTSIGNKLVDINTSISIIDSVVFYSGNCNQLIKTYSFIPDSGYNRYFIENINSSSTQYFIVFTHSLSYYSLQSFDAYAKSECTSQDCNLIRNGGFEDGAIAPTTQTFALINQTFESIVPCWFSAKNKHTCGSAFQNSINAHILDKNYNSTLASCNSGITGNIPLVNTIGIPTNYISDGILNTYNYYDTNNAQINNRYVSIHSGSEIDAQLSEPLTTGKYILEYDYGITHCYNYNYFNLCINFNLPNTSSFPNLITIWNTYVNNSSATLNNLQSGDWVHSTHCIDIPNVSVNNYTIEDATHIGFRHSVDGLDNHEQGGYVFDNFRLTKLAPEIPDYTICSAEQLQLEVPCPVAAVTYSWVPVGTPACDNCLSCTTCTNPVFSYANNTNQAVTFQYKLVASFQGCAAQTFFTIIVKPSYLQTELVNATIPLKSCDSDAVFQVINSSIGIEYTVYVDYVNPLLTDVSYSGTQFNFSSLLAGENAEVWITSYNPADGCLAESEHIFITACCLAITTQNQIDVPYNYTTVSEFVNWAVQNNYLTGTTVTLPNMSSYFAYVPTTLYLEHSFVLNANLIIDNTFRFAQCNFEFGENVSWSIPNTSTYNNIELHFYRSILTAACKDIMWTGMRSLNPLSGIYYDGSVNTYHAINGARSENGGKIIVAPANVFDNNYIGIYALNAINVSNDFLSVVGSTFSNTNGALYAPYNTTQPNNNPTNSYSGISIRNITLSTTNSSSSIIIGDAFNINYFSDSYYGIEVRDASVTVTHNNLFTNHKYFSNTTNTLAGAALYVNASPSQVSNTKLIYSGNTTVGIQISDCDNGVMIEGGRVDVYITGVSIENIDKGIRCRNLKFNGLVRISNCDITKCRYGIYSVGTQNCKYNFSENRIYNRAYTGTITRAYGIYVDELPVTVFSYMVRCNLIFPGANGIGIYLRGTNKASSVIKNNIVNSHSGSMYTLSSVPIGINIINAQATNIIENEVNTISGGLGGFAYSRGLMATKNSYLNIRCNTFKNTGIGLYMNQSNQSSQIINNTFDNNLSSTRFSLNHNIDLGVPGQYHGGNKWFNIINYGIVNTSPNGSVVNVFAPLLGLPYYPINLILPDNSAAPFTNVNTAPPLCPGTECHNEFVGNSNYYIALDSTELAIANSFQESIPNLNEHELDELRRLMFRYLLENDSTLTNAYEDFREYMRENENGEIALIADSIKRVLCRADSSCDISTFNVHLQNILNWLTGYQTENIALLNEKTVLVFTSIIFCSILIHSVQTILYLY
jgi:hypothetical protein